MQQGVGKFAVMLAIALVLGTVAAGAQALDFAHAKEMTLGRNQNLKALQEQYAAALEAARQASALENPEVEVETIDFGSIEVEAVLTQQIPLGGRRGAAIAIAEQEARIAELEMESSRIAIEAELVRRFVPVLGAQLRLALIDSLLDVSTTSVAAVRRLVNAGAAMEVDALRTELEGDELLLERAELERRLREAEAKLSELWGETSLGFDGVEGVLPASVVLPALQDLSAALERHPDSQVLEAEQLLAEAEVDEARAERWPELALSAGYLYETEAEEGFPITAVSLSLPIFNRNQSAVAGKRHELAGAKYGAMVERLERSSDLTVLHSEIEGTARDLRVLSGEVLARATRIHNTLEAFYKEGKTGILDVLEARGHLIELRMRIVDLAEHQSLLMADLFELTGYRLEIIR
jgi:cobalt-zinc-cadmium efflux system outer membrane protein